MAPPTADGGPPIDFVQELEQLESAIEGITAFVAEQVSAAGASGVVVEISGGLNSAVATMLATDALGADRVYGLLLPAYMHTEADALTAELVAEGLGIDYSTVQLLPFVHLFQELSLPDDEGPQDVPATANAVDRIRMACAYYVANTMDRLVVGTECRTERLLGTSTKYGVTRGDLLPLGDHYATEVRYIADHLGIPEGVCASDDGTNPSLAWEVDLDPATLDAVLYRLVDRDGEIDRTATDLDVEPETVRRLAERHARSRHKRSLPPTPETSGAGRYDRFHEIELRFD